MAREEERSELHYGAIKACARLLDAVLAGFAL